MKFLLPFACFTALALAAPAAASTPDLDALYRQQCSEVISGAWPAFTGMLAPDYRGYNIGGDPDTRATEASSIRDLTNLMKLDSCTVAIDVSEVGDQNANAIVHFRMDGSVQKAVGHLRQGDRVTLVFHSADTWKYEGGAWLQVSADTLGSEFFVNGKSVRHQGLT